MPGNISIPGINGKHRNRQINAGNKKYRPVSERRSYPSANRAQFSYKAAPVLNRADIKKAVHLSVHRRLTF